MKKTLTILFCFIAFFASAQDTTSNLHGGIIPFTVLGKNLAGLTNPSAVTYMRINADNSVSLLSASAFLTAIGGSSGGSGGNVYADANKNVGVNNIDSNYVQITSSGGTATLTAASRQVQDVVGTSSHTVQLPSGTAIQSGHNYYIMASTTGTVTVNDGSGALLLTLASGTTGSFTLQTAGSTAGAWKKEYSLIPISTGISGLGTGIATFLATPSSANFFSAITDETGSGAIVGANTPTLITPVLGVAAATSINKVTITAPTTSATLTLVTGSSLITAGAFATTLTSTATTNATLPAGTNTLYSTLSGSITSSQLATSLTDESGTGTAIFGTSPSFVTSVVGGATFAAFNTVSTNLSIGGAATTFSLGGTPTTALTATLFNNATASATTKSISLGAAGASGSTTALAFGSAVSGAINTYTFNQGFFINTQATVAGVSTGSYTIASSITDLNGAGTLTSYTLTMPASPTNGQVVKINFLVAVTSLTITTGSGTILSNPTSATANSWAGWHWNSTNTSWVRDY